MITAVDTNILLDLLIPRTPHGESSARSLGEALGAGAVIISEPVYAELAAHFPAPDDLERFFADTRIRLDHSVPEALYRAGKAWSDYARRRPHQPTCPQCGARMADRCPECGAAIAARRHVVADFLIGAHAAVQADRLLTRDRGYYATYFPGLRLI